MFASRNTIQESLGFSPAELVFGHCIRGPLNVLSEQWLSEPSQCNLLDYVVQFRERLHSAWSIAGTHLKQSQSRMKQWYDRKTKKRSFEPGDEVLVLFPVTGKPLQARYRGPYTVYKKVNDVDYVVQTPDRRKETQLCHINMMKMYHSRVKSSDKSSDKSNPVAIVVPEAVVEDTVDSVEKDCHDFFQGVSETVTMTNSDVMADLESKLSHMAPNETPVLLDLFNEFSVLFSDTPGCTTAIVHDVDVGSARPIKQHPYRMNITKLKAVQDEIHYLLQHDKIELSYSEWSSPVLLVPKADSTWRLCVDFRKVNSVTKTDSHPIPRVDDCIDQIGHAKYVSKFDMLKGYWQVPLTERAKEISAFVTPDGLYQFKVMAFGMKNAPSTFTRLMNKVIGSLPNCVVYIDDVVLYHDTFSEHVQGIRELFQKLTDVGLTINLLKSEIGKGHVTYLGYVVGSGQVKPVVAKVQSIIDFPTPTCKRDIMRLLGVAGYYRRFCPNFSDVVAPLTDLLSKSVKFEWNAGCQNSFELIKAILSSYPVLIAPDFEKPFSLFVDASDVAVGSMLSQKDVQGIEHPVAYFSKKLDKHQRRYSTIEKEALALLLALKHFEVYVGSGLHTLQVYTDHNPLVFVGKFRNNNRRLTGWHLCLQEYDLEMNHIRGKDNVVADALSRI